MAGKRISECVGPSYQLADRKAAVQRAVNLYLKKIESGNEPAQFVLSSVPSFTYLGSAVTSRGIYSTGDKLFYATDSGVAYLEVTAGDLVFGGSVGTLASNSGPVAMKHSETKLVIVDGSNGYVYDIDTGTFTTITADGWRGSNWIEWMDGYFIAAAPNTDQWYISGLDDPLSWDALDFSSADAQPDNIVTFRVLKHELFLFGSRSAEVWINTGAADFPFERYNSTPIDVGCVGVQAMTRTTDSLVWIGQTERGRGYVYMMQGHQPVRISTQAVEEALADSTDISSATLWSYHVAGSEFVGVNAPGVGTTWVYDIATGQWHERGLYVNGEWQQWPPKYISYLEGKLIAIGDPGLMKIDLSPDEEDTTEPGFPYSRPSRVRERTWPHLLSPSYEPVTFRSLELACLTGGGGNITLEVSNDGGYTYGSPLSRSLGVTGRWMQRVRWNFLGASRDRVFRLRCSDDVPLTIHGAFVDAT